MLFEPVEVKLHLAFVAGFEVANLQVNGGQAAELAVVEKQVEVVVTTINLHPLLALDETEADAKLEDECLHLAQDGGFDVLLGVGILEAKEVQADRDHGRPNRGSACPLAEFLKFHLGELGWFLRQGRRSKSMDCDLLVQSAGVPVFDAAHLGVEVTFERIVQVDDLPEVGPAQFCTQCVQNLRVGKGFRATNHVGQVPFRKPATKLRPILPTVCAKSLRRSPRASP